MSWLVPLRALARIELRHFLRHPARTLSLALLVAVPVAAVVGGSVLLDNVLPTRDEDIASVLGAADLRVVLASEADAATLAEQLPDGARVERLDTDQVEAHVPGLTIQARVVRVGDTPLAAGFLQLQSGRAPQAAGEVALTPLLLQAGLCELGDTIALAGGDPARIVGTFVEPEDLNAVGAWVAPASPLELTRRTMLVGLPAGADELEVAADLEAAGHRLMSAKIARNAEVSPITIVFVLGGVGFVEAALVIAAAFSVGLRRRSREFGLLAASGASPRQLLVGVLISSGLLSALGSALGIAVGLLAARILHAHLDGWTGRLVGPFEFSFRLLFLGAALGLASALCSALLPALAIARLPVCTALSCRRPTSAPATRWLIAGALLVAAGLGAILSAPHISGPLIAVAVLGGSVLCVLGFGAASPWVLQALSSLAAPLPLGLRIAVRDAGRFRSRNGPIVTAVVAGMAISVSLAATLATDEGNSIAGPELAPDQLLVEGMGAAAIVERIAARTPALGATELRSLRLADERLFAREPGAQPNGGWVGICAPEDLATYGAQGAAAAFLEGALLDLRGRTQLTKLELFRWGTERAEHTVPAQQVEPDWPTPGPRFLLSNAAAAELGLDVGPAPGANGAEWLMRIDRPVDAELLREARAIASATGGGNVDAAIARGRVPDLIYTVLLSLSIATGLIVIAVATALALAESRADARVLHTVGAAPGLLHRLSAARSGYLALLGCLLAVPAGLVPSWGLTLIAGNQSEFLVPWNQLALLVLGLPTLATLGTWATSLGWGRLRPT